MALSMDRWIGKVAVVTGASSGIGAAVVTRLVEEGIVVVGFARRIDRMEELARELEGKRGSFHPIKCDVTLEEEILEGFNFVRENLGPCNILINNAGTAKISSLRNGEVDKWKSVLDVNVLGLSICTREAIKDMEAHEIQGHIIHMNSIFGHSVSKDLDLNMYPASKYAVGALAESLRQEFNKEKSNIKITSLSPGIVMTEIFEALGMDYETVKQASGGNLPCLNASDIADSVVYILSTPPNVLVTELTIRPINETI